MYDTRQRAVACASDRVSRVPIHYSLLPPSPLLALARRSPRCTQFLCMYNHHTPVSQLRITKWPTCLVRAYLSICAARMLPTTLAHANDVIAAGQDGGCGCPAAVAGPRQSCRTAGGVRSTAGTATASGGLSTTTAGAGGACGGLGITRQAAAWQRGCGHRQVADGTRSAGGRCPRGLAQLATV